MSSDDNTRVYKALNACVAILNEDVATGIASVYVTVDRHKYNELLKELLEAKKALLRHAIVKT